MTLKSFFDAVSPLKEATWKEIEPLFHRTSLPKQKHFINENETAHKIAFLESGDYEVHFAAYKDLNSAGKLDFQGTLILNSLIDLLDLQIGANANIQLNVSVVGILP